MKREKVRKDKKERKTITREKNKKKSVIKTIGNEILKKGKIRERGTGRERKRKGEREREGNQREHNRLWQDKQSHGWRC